MEVAAAQVDCLPIYATSISVPHSKFSSGFKCMQSLLDHGYFVSLVSLRWVIMYSIDHSIEKRSLNCRLLCQGLRLWLHRIKASNFLESRMSATTKRLEISRLEFNCRFIWLALTRRSLPWPAWSQSDPSQRGWAQGAYSANSRTSSLENNTEVSACNLLGMWI